MILLAIIMTLTIDNSILQEARVSEERVLILIALELLRQGILTNSQAAELAKQSRIEFQRTKAEHGFVFDYDIQDLEKDLQTLVKLKEQGLFQHSSL